MIRLENIYNNIAKIYLYFSVLFTFSSLSILLVPDISCFLISTLMSLLIYLLFHSKYTCIKIACIPLIMTSSMLVLNCIFHEYIDRTFFYSLNILLSISFIILYLTTKFLGKKYSNVIAFLITGIILIYVAPIVIFISGVNFKNATISIMLAIILLALFVNVIYNIVMHNKKMDSITIFLLLFGSKT